jgi:hypothetical protein
MARIIGITGLAGAGKDTFALSLQKVLVSAGREVRIESFADPIRKISQSMGLEPYDRTMKEQRRVMFYVEFCDSLYQAIEDVLAERMVDEVRVALYAFTVEACEKFCYHDSYDGETRRCIEISPREFMQVLGTEGGQRVRQGLWVDTALMQWRSFPGFVLVTDCRFEYEVKKLDRLFVVSRPGVTRVNQHVSEDLAEKLTNGIRPAFVALESMLPVNNSGSIEFLDSFARLSVPFVTGV